ncbi:MAG: alcohol dehydrogenase catalytic domain-containing protein [Candidatus Krumholzibacteria bacterium]|nr:alcohol dehydrogenase catalytic domain-containing protein [Candidatus Krumholzibacteria bacterium]MDH4336130.1 alcohol dehydrogenase catalytic domain-containing protein [Candidatus Krumholzibacteria bacterium]MDH5268771.1 alcohol dehydrogenase catalytic domain-containing protein [Candidatus Krumholzibacteria bacterium]
MKAVVFDGAIPRYLLTLALGAVSKRAMTGPLRCTRLRDVPEPALPGDRWVRVKTLLGGICGSDLNLVSLHVSPSTSPFSSFPFVIGHENVGVVSEVGAAVTRVKPGDRVVVNPLLACGTRGIDPPCRHCAGGYPSRCEHFTDGALAPGMLLGTTRGLGGSWGEQYLAHESQVTTPGAAVSDRAALLTEPLACVISPLLEHPPATGARALVIGAGSMGLLATSALEALTDADVTVLARHRFQAEHAEHVGADRIVSGRSAQRLQELSRLSGGRLLQPILGPPIHVGGFDVTVLCVGSDAAVQDALRFTRAGGTILLLANVASLKRVDWTPVWIKELTIHGSLCYNAPGHAGAHGGAFQTAASLLEGSLGSRLEPLVTHVVPRSDFRHALALAWGRGGSGAVKVALAAD